MIFVHRAFWWSQPTQNNKRYCSIINASIASLSFTILIALPLLIVASFQKLHFSIASIPVILNLLYSASHLSILSASATLRLIKTTFWIFVYIFFGVCALAQITSMTFPWPGDYTDTTTVKSGFIIFAGLLAFDVGYLLTGALRGKGVPKVILRPLHKQTVLILVFIALLLALYMIQKMGGLAVLFTPRHKFFMTLSSHLTMPEFMLLTHLARTPIYVLAIAMFVIWVARHRNKLNTSVIWKMLGFSLLAVALILNNPVSTARVKIGTILLSLFFLLPWRRWSNAITVMCLVFALLVIFPFADLYRSDLDNNLSEHIAKTSPYNEIVKNGDFDAFQQVINTVKTVEKSGLRFGVQVGGSLLFFVPRSIWPNKPVATGQWVAERMGYGYTNLSSPLWAEFYVDGGWLLLVLGFIGYGYLVGILDKWYAQSSWIGTPPRVVSLVVPIYAGYQFFLLRGALMPAIAYFTPILLFALLCGMRPGIGRIRR